MKSLEDVAYHEAGHAIAHLLVKKPFRKITIIPKKDYDGIVIGKLMTIDCRDLIYISAAGFVTDSLRGLGIADGIESDIKNCHWYCREMDFDDKAEELYMEFQIYQLKQDLIKNWQKVEKVADKLLDKKTLK